MSAGQGEYHTSHLSSALLGKQRLSKSKPSARCGTEHSSDMNVSVLNIALFHCHMLLPTQTPAAKRFVVALSRASVGLSWSVVTQHWS